ncbi:MAG: hypothetical protein R2788_16890 [Saprospiraceae bacterium]
MFQSGGPSQLDLFDYKPTLIETGEDLPNLSATGNGSRA